MEFNVDLSAKVTSFEQVDDLLEIILSKMDEPNLEDKIRIKFVLSEKEMHETIILYSSKIKEEISESQIKYVDAINVPDKKNPNLYTLGIKSDILANFFVAYFHELGHVANPEVYNKGLPDLEEFVISEALADLFANWATEEFNLINNKKFKNRKLILEEALRIHDDSLNPLKESYERDLVNRFLLDFYKIFQTSKQIYKTLQVLVNESPRTLQAYISNHY